ncbi:hypothetical protein EOPP23_13840 [Endozoicomonas sp. OPT23]|uniref:hypothetical protein n=1 Tax=Endozoicomonas sp. OPT23 TaxID=2072845 RepID=UPI00129BE622|nr:hypothetical protein [Endozoicomonas sp. OPT23]MRI34072.1 hypothetical protein [Endozoicomonas sp. OPT23]
MTDPQFMLEYLDRVGVDVKKFTDEKALKSEYLRHIYRVDARDTIVDTEGKLKVRTKPSRKVLH